MNRIPNFEPPELEAAASKLIVHLSLRMLLHGLQLGDVDATVRLITAYMVTTDKAAREYLAGRTALLRHKKEGGIQAYIEGVNHFETCINSAKRAIRVFERLGSSKEKRLIDRETKRLVESKSKAITDIRDRIEHLDGDIVGHRLGPGVPHLLTLSADGSRLELGTDGMTIHDLHRVVELLHQVGMAIICRLPDRNGEASLAFNEAQEEHEESGPSFVR